MNANEKRKNQVQVVFVEIITKNNEIMYIFKKYMYF